MIPKNYTHSTAARLAALTLAPVETPEALDILWLRTFSFERSTRQISLKKHKHSFYEAHFVFEGSITYEADGVSYKVCGGEAILIPPELQHRVGGFSDNLIKINIAFTAHNSSFSYISNLEPLRFSISDGAMADFERIIYEAERRAPHYTYIVRDRVFSILCTILRYAKIAEISPRAYSENGAVARALRYIQDNKNVFLTCRDVAVYCSFNDKYLGRLFKKELGITLLEYIHAVKLDEAKRLLSDSEASLSEVSEMLGFASEQYFSSFFKKKSGTTPRQFRASVRK